MRRRQLCRHRAGAVSRRLLMTVHSNGRAGGAPTKGTQIAALEAKHNEEQVLAEGALFGERRVAWARLAMTVMFGVLTNVRPQGNSFEIQLAGTIYTLLA